MKSDSEIINELLDKILDLTKERDAWIAEYRAARREIERLKEELYKKAELNK